ncbi:MAG: hypothetical protein ABI432_08470 [Flavobacteriales bacterium]
MKARMLTGWTVQRWLRLAFAVFFGITGIVNHEPVALIAGAFFGAQALFNVGCCGVPTCAPRVNDVNTAQENAPEVVYEEIT